jgi:hypothetical protein
MIFNVYNKHPSLTAKIRKQRKISFVGSATERIFVKWFYVKKSFRDDKRGNSMEKV